MAATMGRFGQIHTPVNNAGIFVSKLFMDYIETDFATVVAVSLAGFFHLTRRAVAPERVLASQMPGALPVPCGLECVRDGRGAA